MIWIEGGGAEMSAKIFRWLHSFQDCGVPLDYPGDWLVGSVAFFALLFGPLLLLDFFYSTRKPQC